MIKIKNSNLLRLGLSLVLTISFCLINPTTPASAQPGLLQWGIVNTPSNLGNVIVSPSAVNDIAIGYDGRTFYAIDIPHSKVYKSANWGTTWDDLSSHLTGSGAVLPVWNIAIAPDNPDFVAVVTSSAAGLPGEVFISTNGGAKWQNTNCPAASNIGAIDISMNYGSYDIAIGTRTGTGGGAIYVYKADGYGSWAAQGFTGDILAARFSPNYASDSSLVIVSASSANTSGTYVNIGIRDMAANTTNWSTWSPVEITTGGAGTSPRANQIITADLELPSDFLGQTATLRRIYVNTDDANASGNAGVYRIDDTIIYQLMSATAKKRIASIAYYGTYNIGKLLAAEVKSNTPLAAVDIWYSSDPEGACLTWKKPTKPPTGGGNSGYANAQVAWSPDGSKAYCGTSSANLNNASSWPGGYQISQPLDESAFSITLDNGDTWNQLGLIDTEISFLSDVVASDDSKILYLASINTHGGLNNFDSIWRSTSYPAYNTWERVLCVLTTTDDIILRMSHAKTDQSIFYAARFTNDLRQSQDNGQTWHKTLPGINVTDFAITKTNGTTYAYVLEDNFVRKGTSTYQTWKWKTKVDTYLNSGHTITATPRGIILVGDAAQGMVAYSEDSGDYFTRLPAVPVPGKIHIVTDIRIQDYIVIYAASDGAGGEIYSWVVNASSGWTPMASPGQGFYGLGQAGILYGAWSDGINTGVDRSLNPEALGTPFIEWNSLTTGLNAGVIFTREPTSLKVSDNVDLWAIDNRAYTTSTGRLWAFSDCLTRGPQPIPQEPSPESFIKAPALISPSRDEIISTDADIYFRWQHRTPAEEYDLWIATDKEFSQIVMQQKIIPDNPLSPVWRLSSEAATLEIGKTYYWKVRVNRAATGEPSNGQWSEVASFIIASELSSETPRPDLVLLTPVNDAKDVAHSPSFSWTPLSGATEYELTLAKDETLKQIVAVIKIPDTSYDYDAMLDGNTSYFWQVRATQPLISQPSAIASFTVAATESKLSSWMPDLPLWLWAAIATLIVVLLAVFIVRKIKPDIFKGFSGKLR